MGWIPDEEKDVTVDPTRQSGIHLWREIDFWWSLLALDALVEALKASDLKIYRHIRA